MELNIVKNQILSIVVYLSIFFIVLILMSAKDSIKNVHVVFILVLVLVLILKNSLLIN